MPYSKPIPKDLAENLEQEIYGISNPVVAKRIATLRREKPGEKIVIFKRKRSNI